MKRVMMLCNNFSPTGGTGILRTLKFSKYLPDSNWEPVITHIYNSNIIRFLSSKPEIVFNTKRYSSLHSRSIEKAGLFLDRYLHNSRYLFLPDIYLFSILPTIIKAVRVNKAEQVDLIYCSCSPYSLAIAGALVKKIIHRPLVVDLRDAWTINPYGSYPSRLHLYVDDRLENFVFNTCDKIIVVTDTLRKEYIGKYNGSISRKICTITNGFDPEDIREYTPPADKFVITYTGNFFKKRSPDLFLRGLKKFVQKYSSLDLEVHFYGYSGELTESLTEKYCLNKYVSAHPRIPHKDVYVQLARSHLLLFIEPSDAVPTKLYEYMSVGRPVMAIIPEGEAANLIRKYSPFSEVVTGDEDEIADMIEKYYINWKGNNHMIQSTIPDFLLEFDRRNLTVRLAETFDQVLRAT